MTDGTSPEYRGLNGKGVVEKVAVIKGAAVGGAIATAATTAASTAVVTAAAGTATSLTVGSAFGPFVAAMGAAKVASLPLAVLFLATPVGAAVAGAALTVGGAIAGLKVATALSKNSAEDTKQ